jgi:gamma-glutamylcyclotransferase (GGCT)/AIG2-like uncharacterized protein YtfP
MRHLFAYGTLMCDDIFAEVSGLQRSGIPAALCGYRRRSVVGAAYPGIIACAEDRVDGVIYRALPASAWRRLDRFEGEMYLRQGVRVQLAGGGAAMAETYVVRPAYRRRLTSVDWDFTEFLCRGKSQFRREYRGYR